jgi:GAF domain-containing protein
MRLEDYSTWEGRPQAFKDLPIQAVLEVPMLFGGELIGVLVAEETAHSGRTYTEDDEHLFTLFAAQAAGAIRSARLYDESVRRINYLQTLRSIDRAITANMDSSVTLKILLNQAINQADIDAVSILLFNPHTLRLEYRLGEGFRTRANQNASIRLGESYAGVVALERRMISITDPSEMAEGPFKEFMLTESLLACHFVPMIAKGQVLGVLQAFSRDGLGASRELLEFLEALATQAAIALDNAQLFQGLQEANFELSVAYDATIERWSAALENRQQANEAHMKQLIEWTMQMARSGLEEKMIATSAA